LLLYQYFGWEAPELCHLPLLRNPDKSKLSKRKNPTGIEYYRRAGYLPEALLNYLGRMGWSMADEAEKFTLQEMIAGFDLERISLGGPIFDVEKLKWLNGRWIRENLSDEEFANRVVEWALNRDYMQKLVPMVKPRVETFADLSALAGHFFMAEPKLAPTDFQHKKLAQDDVKRVLQVSAWMLDTLPEWSPEAIRAAIERICTAMNLKLRDLVAPLFVAMTGMQTSTPIFETMTVVGQELTRTRLRRALETLGGLTNNESKELAAQYSSLLPDKNA
jgi:glutamyl-tRNA synthetase